MADTTGKIFDLGFSADKPSITELDTLGTRNAIVKGVQKGLTRQATSQVTGMLGKVTPVADQMAGQIAEPIESGLTRAAQLQGQSYLTATNQIRDSLNGVAGIAAAILPPAPKKRQQRKNGATAGTSQTADGSTGQPSVESSPTPASAQKATTATAVKPPSQSVGAVGSAPAAAGGGGCGVNLGTVPLPGPNTWCGYIAWQPSATSGLTGVVWLPNNCAYTEAYSASFGGSALGTYDTYAELTAAYPGIIAGSWPGTSPLWPQCGTSGSSPPPPPPPPISGFPSLRPRPPRRRRQRRRQLRPLRPVWYVRLTVVTSPPPPPAAASCPEITCTCPGDLTIAWLDLHYPQFVLASRAAGKTDYDILVDGYNLGLCEGDAGEMPECSIPYLERIAPAFIEAAKSQGKTDREVLRDAVAIGLCAKPAPGQHLGTTEVDELAADSASVLESEFDPPIPPPISTTPVSVDTSATGSCPSADYVLPDYSSNPLIQPPETVACLAGLDNAAVVISQVISQVIRDFCTCPDSSPIAKIFQAAATMRKEWSVGGKVFGSITEFLGIVLRNLGCNVQVIDNYLAALTRCGIGESTPTVALALIAGAVDKWVATLPAPIKSAIDSALKFACPTSAPSYAEANVLFASNFISRDQWECLLRRDGFRIDYGLKQVAELQARPTDDQLLLLQRKLETSIANANAGTVQPGDIPSGSFPQVQDTLSQLYAHNGWTNSDNWQLWQQAQQWVPAPTDAVEWMLKDVADPQIQQTFLLSAEFAQKYNGHVRDVFQWNGISDNDALNIWQAHWRNMAPHTLYELHKRLRPGWTSLRSDEEVMIFVESICPRTPNIPGFNPLVGRPVSNGFPVPTYCEELADPVTARAYLESLVTTGYHVSEALGQDDYAPFWRQRLLALSYNTLGRIDLRRAYQIGAISYERLVSGYMDIGYSPGDAASLARFTDAANDLTFSRSPLVAQWVNTGYDIGLLQTALKAQGMSDQAWPDVLAIAQSRRAIKVQQDCLRGLQKQFMLGLIDDNALTAQLNNLGIPADGQASLVADWRCVKAQKSKVETAAQICTMFRVGLLTGQQAQRLLMGNGYTAGQSRRILALCYIRKLPKTLQVDKLPEALQVLGGLG